MAIMKPSSVRVLLFRSKLIYYRNKIQVNSLLILMVIIIMWSSISASNPVTSHNLQDSHKSHNWHEQEKPHKAHKPHIHKQHKQHKQHNPHKNNEHHKHKMSTEPPHKPTDMLEPIPDKDAPHSNRSFIVDYDNNQFLKDGKPFRFIAGSFHYFRALHQTWQRKLRTMKSAGLNAIATYVDWSLHNPKDEVYRWEGIADLELFIQLAADEDLLVILRPGPYICAERDNGGFPYWLLGKYPKMSMRSLDKDYKAEAHKWFQQLMPKMVPYLYGNGGPIIMVQIENEYGSIDDCNRNYSIWAKEETEKYVQDKAVLFTNDGPAMLKCGKIDGVLATLDFGAESNGEISKEWEELRKYQPQGPLVNMEFYPGWLTHWQQPYAREETDAIVNALKTILIANASVNFYMFYGGTNFGFSSGANIGGPSAYHPDITSYDYDAPMDESGDPTPKFMALRKVILDYLPQPKISVPEIQPKMRLPDIALKPVATLLSKVGRKNLASAPTTSTETLTFEELNQFSGFVLYETTIPRIKTDPCNLVITKLQDRAHILIDGYVFAILSRGTQVNTTSISTSFGKKLQILVENQGRINQLAPNDFKGILGDVKINEIFLTNWTITGFPFDDYKQIKKLLHLHSRRREKRSLSDGRKGKFLHNGPIIYHANFDIPLEPQSIVDTHLNPMGWGKGIVFINGFNLGRYWPIVGPQITLYLPKELLKVGENELVIVELLAAPKDNTIIFSDKAITVDN